MYAEHFESRGFAVTVSNSAAEGVERAAQAGAIVTGIRLFGPIDGIEFVRSLRADARTATKPIIVLTAITFDTDRQRAIDAGCTTFLLKPCLPEKLADEVLAALPRTKDRRGRSRRTAEVTIAPRRERRGADRRRE